MTEQDFDNFVFDFNSIEDGTLNENMMKVFGAWIQYGNFLSFHAQIRIWFAWQGCGRCLVGCVERSHRLGFGLGGLHRTVSLPI